MTIEIKNVSKSFGDFNALKDVSLRVETGEMIALLGPSGSGKTTLLRIIAGLDFPDAGTVYLQGEEVADKTVKDRNIGFVFQHYALFKHMTVFENVAFGLRVRPKETRPSNEEIEEKVMNLLRLVYLDKFHDRYPNQLSGGQRQRVALARALAVEPKVLLLDEPFGALDAKVRKELRRWMRKLHDEINVTSVFVTHDQEEAMEVSDRVVVMSNGKIEQVGTPEEVYLQPSNSFVYDFLGNYNQFEGVKDKDGKVHLLEVDIKEIKKSDSENGLFGKYPEVSGFFSKLVPEFLKRRLSENNDKMLIEEEYKTSVEGKLVRIYARPHEMYISKTPEVGKDFISAKVIHVNPAGSLVKLELERKNGKLIQVETPRNVIAMLNIAKGDEILVTPKQVKVFDEVA
jgi:sulfate transport system ATP-binding protein